ncbi:hypothetical protein CAEBREN_25891 [Caenorhabditis brenneri]|uniref:Bardet-Biedl syndrome 1 N-terminal domain-containing protein n=1 Tax=Caenorhabditis brenneri TaxID=135651 RepID=G0NCM0_CAEBE|nr:hypothetical protein CAEBREN_25891 [Caenorhabditis brenneri]
MAKPLEVTQSKWTAPVVLQDHEIHCPSTCVTLGPLLADNESMLIIAHGGHRGVNMKLKVFQGLSQHSESSLADMPTAIMHFVNELFTVPSSVINSDEQEAWSKFAVVPVNPDKLFNKLKDICDRVSFSNLTPMSQTYLMSEREEQLALIDKFGAKIANTASITCITKMMKSMAESLDILIIGTEHCNLYFLDSQAFTLLHEVKLSSVPVSLCAYGSFDVDYRVFVQTRDSLIFSVKRDEENHQPIIVSQSMITSMVLMNKIIVYTTSDNLITFASFRGKKINTVKCKDKVKMLEPFSYTQKQLSAVIAVFEKEIRLYNDQYMLDVVQYEKPLAWVKFGLYGREDATLIVCFKDGTIAVQIFRRTAQFEKQDYNYVPPSHALKLAIPKKTKIFIDQTQRELEYGNKIHQAYQKNLFNLKFKIAENYQQLAQTATASVSTTTVLPMDISVDIHGFGPNFRMTVHLLSKQTLYDMFLSMINDPDLYEIDKPLMPVSILTPGNTYDFTTMIVCKDPEKAQNSEIRVLLVHQKRATPIVTAVIKMPFSEFPLE